MTPILRKLWADDEGQDIAEYASCARRGYNQRELSRG